jgi:hypothetical protein
MFAASVFFCFLSVNGVQCLIAEDNRGPYKNEAQCHERIVEMSEAIVRTFPYPQIRGVRCAKPEGASI